MTVNEMREKFDEKYGAGDDVVTVFAPGRVNLIGEHIDYNGGYVFPCALSFGTYIMARRRNDKQLNLASMNLALTVSAQLDEIKYSEENDWANYPLGVVYEFIKSGLAPRLRGMDLLFYGDVPRGSGLSSSASLEVAMATLVNHMFGLDIDMVELVKKAQRAENTFVGVSCGIMDQFASGMGKKDHALMLRCSDLEYQYAPLNLGGMKIIIANTNKKRGLVDSKYNERRAECDAAFNDLKGSVLPNIDYLCDIEPKMFEGVTQFIKSTVAAKRARHAVYENQRVIDAFEKLKNNDIDGFGALMVQSHESLRDLYEVTGEELDVLFEEAMKVDGCVGSRMTGAGFGGCTVSIVKDEAVEGFIEKVGKNYTKRTGNVADFYVAEIGRGAYIV